jgi:hypothetical protein
VSYPALLQRFVAADSCIYRGGRPENYVFSFMHFLDLGHAWNSIEGDCGLELGRVVVVSMTLV